MLRNHIFSDEKQQHQINIYCFPSKRHLSTHLAHPLVIIHYGVVAIKISQVRLESAMRLFISTKCCIEDNESVIDTYFHVLFIQNSNSAFIGGNASRNPIVSFRRGANVILYLPWYAILPHNNQLFYIPHITDIYGAAITALT